MTALDTNLANYEAIYSARQTFLRYPADWVIRFHNIYMREHLPTGRVLDFGCGSGNNMKFFADHGYDVTGTDITPAALPLVSEIMGRSDQTIILPPDIDRLPFEDYAFDFILSNQVLYYLADRERIEAMARELGRVLRPGGAVFFTMIGPRNYYIAQGHARQIAGNVHELKIDDGRLTGFHQIFYVTPDEADLKEIFGAFDPLTIGYFDQWMFDMKSNFHWIFAGQKPK